MAAFVAVIGVLLLWLVFGGVTGKQRGLVIINLRAVDTVLTLEDGQSARFQPGESQTIFAKKADFPQTFRVTSADGAPVFEQRIDYKALVDAEFRIAIGDDRIVFPVKPPAE
jgi:hypothetical protein